MPKQFFLIVRTGGKSGWRLNSLPNLLTILLIVVCSWHYAARLGGIAQYQQVRPPIFSKPIGGVSSLDYEFTARSSLIGRIYLFPSREQLKRSKSEEILLELIDVPSLSVLERHLSMVSDVTFVLEDSLVFTPGWQVEKNKRYRLRLSLPNTPSDRGLPFILSPALENNTDLCWINGQEQRGLVPNHLILGPKPAFPLWVVALGGLILLWIAFLRPQGFRWHVFLITAVCSLVLSVYLWERDLWVFWGEYWPDRYVFMTYGIQERWSGISTMGDVLRFLVGEPSGCNFIIPILLAGLNSLGLPYIYSYTMLSFAFSLGTILLITNWAVKNWQLEDTHAAFLIVLTGLNLIVVRGFARPLTDAGGMFFTTLFVVSFTECVRGEKSSPFACWIAVLTICLGIFTRIALLPLLMVPVAFAICRYIFQRPLQGGHLWKRPLAVSMIAATIVAGVLEGLGLSRSVAATTAFAAREEFRSQFSLAAYVKQSLIALQLALPLGILRAKRFLLDHRLTIPLLTILGFQTLLLFGRIIPWLRYWAPIAPLACGITCALIFEGRQGVRKWQLAVLGTVIAGNLVFIAFSGSY